MTARQLGTAAPQLGDARRVSTYLTLLARLTRLLSELAISRGRTVRKGSLIS
jgi:hypothetical protein